MNEFAKNASSSNNEMEQDNASLIRADSYTYNSLINYYANRKGQHLSAQRAEDLLLQMSELSQKYDNNIQMSSTPFNIVLKAWSNSGGGIQGAQRAETILQMMIRLCSKGHENVRPNAVSFSTVINAYSKVDPEDASIAVERVMQLLDEFEGSYIAESDTNISSPYNAAANMIAKSGLHDAADRVEILMKRMNNMDTVPDAHMYFSMIEGYARTERAGALRKGKEKLLELMGGEEPKIQPDSVPFNILLNATLKRDATNKDSGLPKDDDIKRPTAKLDQAEELIATMEKIGGNARPDVRTFNTIISFLSRSPSKDTEQKAVEYLRKMLKSYSDGYERAKPDSFAFNCIISMLARSKQNEWAENVIHRSLMAMENQRKRGNTSVIPDTITYNSVIGKLAQTATKNNAKKVMKLLATMEENSRSNEAIAPDAITYTNVLLMQEKLNNPLRAAHIASSCLERAMSKDKNFMMDRLAFRTMLLALSRSRKFEHAMMARKAWEWMENDDSTHKVLDSSLCNLVLISYNKTNDAKAAEEVLTFLSERIKRYNNGDKTTILPTVVGFGAALKVLSKRGRVDDALRLVEIMKSLSNEDGMTNLIDDGVKKELIHLKKMLLQTKSHNSG